MLSGIKRRLRSKIWRHILRVDGERLTSRMNRYSRLVQYEPSLQWDSAAEQYIVTDKAGVMRVPRKTRLKWYRQGIEQRLSSIRTEYLLQNVDICDDDIIIDIGANIGEVSKSLASIHRIRVIVVEPESLEVEALSMNLNNVEHEVFQCPLWASTMEVDWHSANDSGDSSIFKPSEGSQGQKLKAYALDELLQQSKILANGEQIKILKLEAEGAEPEILQGAVQTLKRVSYVTVDVGPERGIHKETTLIPVVRILTEAGFRPIQFGLPRPVLLFKKQ